MGPPSTHHPTTDIDRDQGAHFTDHEVQEEADIIPLLLGSGWAAY